MTLCPVSPGLALSHTLGQYATWVRDAGQWCVQGRHPTLRDAVQELLEIAGSAAAIRPALDLLALTMRRPC